MNNLRLFNLRKIVENDGSRTRFKRIGARRLILLKNAEIEAGYTDKGNFVKLQLKTDLTERTLISELSDDSDSFCFSSGSKLEFFKFEENQVFEGKHFENTVVTFAWTTRNLLSVLFENNTVEVHGFNDEFKWIGREGRAVLDDDKAKFEHLNVGWGSEETQFKGGRRMKTKDLKTDEIKYPLDERAPTISWQTSEESFVVNFYSATKRKRLFKIYSCKCELLYLGEETNGLQAPSSWRPNSIYIGIPIFDGAMHIGMFEKCGYYRNKFALVNTFSVEKLDWSADGNILAVLQKTEETTPISLYYYKNGTWHLKQYLNFAKENLVKDFAWFNLFERYIYNVTVLTTSGVYDYSFKLSFTSHVYNDTNDVLNYVVDGHKVRMRFLNKTLVPNEDEHDTITLNAPFNQLTFHPEQTRLYLMDSNDNVYVFDASCDSNLKYTFELMLKSIVPNEKGLPFYNHFIWNDFSENSHSTKFPLDKSFSIQQTGNYEGLFDIDCTSNKISIIEHKLLHANLIKDTNNFKVEFDTVPLYVTSKDIAEQNKIFALTISRDFYVNHSLLLQNVTSFAIQGDFLHLTTVSNELLTLRYHESGKFINLKQVISRNLYYKRQIEAGAILVAALPNSAQMILELPRGNLEILESRVVLLNLLDSLFTKNKWKELMDLVRINKVNVNVICDFNIKTFLMSIPSFIYEVESNSLLNQFLLGLEDENVFYTLYKNCLNRLPEVIENKKKVICSRIVQFLDTIEFLEYLPCIATCFQVIAPSSALSYTFNYISKVFYCNANETILKYTEKTVRDLFNNNSANEIFNAALNTFNIELAEFVCNVVNIDPREHAKLFDKIKSVSEIEKRYLINVYLEQWEYALIYMVRCKSDKNEIFDFVRRNSLHSKALEIIRMDEDVWHEINADYGDVLYSKGAFDYAALIYKNEGLLEKAYAAYKQCRKYNELVTLLCLMDIDEEEVLKRKREIACLCVEEKKYQEAVSIYKEMGDINGVIDTLIRAKVFKEALHEAERIRDVDLINSEIIPNALTYLEELQASVDNTAETFKEHFLRLKVLRENEVRRIKKIVHEVLPNEEVFQENMIMMKDDLYSEAGTCTTSTSRSTSSSKRRTERKMLSLKRGGIYENIALIRYLHQIITDTFKLSEEIRELCLLLMKTDLRKSKNLHDSLHALQCVMLDCLATIWPLGLNTFQVDKGDYGLMAARINIDLLDFEFRTPPKNLNLDWTVSIFKEADA